MLKDCKISVCLDTTLRVTGCFEEGEKVLVHVEDLSADASAEHVEFTGDCYVDMIYQAGLTPLVVVGLSDLDVETCVVEASGNVTYHLVVALAKDSTQYNDPAIATYIDGGASAVVLPLCN